MEIGIVLALLGAAVVLFMSERLPVDVVAMIILASLLGLGILTAEEGLSGFANTATVTVAAMLVISAGLQRTGAVVALGGMMRKISSRPSIYLLALMSMIGVISAFVNNTAAVAVLLPLVLASCARRKIAPSKILIPLSYASQFGGVCTLIGTSTNLLVSAIAVQAGLEAFTMFEFSLLGSLMLVTGMVYFLVIGQRLLPQRRSSELTEAYELREYLGELRVMEGSPLIDKSVRQSKLRKEYQAEVLEIIRDGRKIAMPRKEKILENDVLLVEGRIQDLLALADTMKVTSEPNFELSDKYLREGEQALVEVMISPRSSLINRTLNSLDFHRRYNLVVLAIQRMEKTLRQQLSRIRLRFGDALLVQGSVEAIDHIRRDSDFIVMTEVDSPSLRRGKAPLALSIAATVVCLAALNVLPILTSSLLGCVAMILTRCLDVEEAYQAVDWKIIFLLAGILPLGVAMQKSGAAALIADYSLGAVEDLGPVAILAMLYLLTAVLTECMSNNASAVLLAPIAISLAQTLEVSPKPFLMAVCFAASTSFATPVGYQTNTMVYNPGGYRFSDFMKVGIPLNLLFWMIATVFIPIIWPF